jgi:hypothetical protein
MTGIMTGMLAATAPAPIAHAAPDPALAGIGNFTQHVGERDRQPLFPGAGRAVLRVSALFQKSGDSFAMA